jgi:hypothetical protein
VLALRHQLHVPERSHFQLLRLTPADRLLWVRISRVWKEWRAVVGERLFGRDQSERLPLMTGLFYWLDGHRITPRSVQTTSAVLDRCDAPRPPARVLRNAVVHRAARGRAGLSDETKSRQPQIPWKQIAGMRDKVIHDYFGVNLEIIWAVLEKESPKLAEAIKASLET